MVLYWVCALLLRRLLCWIGAALCAWHLQVPAGIHVCLLLLRMKSKLEQIDGVELATKSFVLFFITHCLLLKQLLDGVGN